MMTVGEMLKERRIEKGYSLKEVEQATKIRHKFLLAIEADDYSILPSLAYAKGFVKNYGEYLGLNSDAVLAFFRRQTEDIPKSSIVPQGMAQPLNRTTFRLTPTRFLVFLLLGMLSVFLFYFLWQYRNLHQAPQLVVESPKHQFVTGERRVDVLGITHPDATVTVNGVSVLVRGDGRFFDQVTLEPGVNKMTIVATSRFGKTTTIIREVGFQQP